MVKMHFGDFMDWNITNIDFSNSVERLRFSVSLIYFGVMKAGMRGMVAYNFQTKQKGFPANGIWET